MNTPREDDWRTRGLCAEFGPDDSVWFPGVGQPIDAARAICRECPVQAECLAYALPRPELEGVWAGLSWLQRKRLRTQQRKETAS